MWLIRLASLAWISSLAASASATEIVHGAELTVRRSESAAQCPDEGALAQRLRGRVKEVDTPLTVAVALDGSEGVLSAEIRLTGRRQGVRQLAVEGSDCSVLADALVVSLTLALDPNARLDASAAEDSPTPETLTSKQPEPAADGPLAPAPPESESGTTGDEPEPKESQASPPVTLPRRAVAVASIGAGGALQVGILPAPSFGPQASLGLGLDWLSTRLRASYLPSQSFNFAGGRVESLGALANWELCVAIPLRGRASFEACTLATLEYQRVGGVGFAEERTTEAWGSRWGLGASIRDQAWGSVGWELGLSGLVRAGERTFTVDRVGDAHTTELLAVSGFAGLFWSSGTPRNSQDAQPE